MPDSNKLHSDSLIKGITSLTDMHKAILKECLIELYKNFNIIWSTDVATLSNEDFPLFSDLYALIEKKATQKGQNIRDNELLIADECYMMIDPNVPQSLVFLRNVAKKGKEV